MSILSSIIEGPIGALISGVKDLIGQKLNNDHDKMEVSVKLGELQNQLQLALAEADSKFADAQQAVIVAEAKSESWIVRSWRPLLMLFFGFVIGWVIFHGAFDLSGREIPAEYVKFVFTIVQYGVTGYVVGRSAEKVLPDIVAVVKGISK